MSRFNKKTKNRSNTVNKEGAEAFKMSAEMELVSMLLTSFVQNAYYESADDLQKRLKSIIQDLPDPKFAAQAAIYARTKFGMRSITHLTAAEIAFNVKHEQWTRSFFDKIVHRPDDITEILSLYIDQYGKNVPGALKEGIARAFTRFDGYSLAKYRSENKKLTLVDAVNITHPFPGDKVVPVEKSKYLEAISDKKRKTINESELSDPINISPIEALVFGLLKNKDTWESRVSEAGQKATSEEHKKELKANAWEDLVKTKKIGHFALLRNLRNIIEQAPDLVDEAIALLKDEARIKKSLIMPFRFYSAYKEIEKLNNTSASKVLGAISDALDISCQNIPELKGGVMIGIDNSHSMVHNPISEKSTITRCEIACLLACILHRKAPNTITAVFADEFKVKNLNPSNSVLANMQTLSKVDVGAGCNTNGFKVPEHAWKNKIDLKYFMIFTDLQMYDAEGVSYCRTPPAPGRSFKKELQKYRNDVNAGVKCFSFDCAGYGTLQIPEGDQNSYLIPGFSDKMFELIEKLELDRSALINEIKAIRV